jgi:hypothetical protein
MLANCNTLAADVDFRHRKDRSLPRPRYDLSTHSLAFLDSAIRTLRRNLGRVPFATRSCSQNMGKLVGTSRTVLSHHHLCDPFQPASTLHGGKGGV